MASENTLKIRALETELSGRGSYPRYCRWDKKAGGWVPGGAPSTSRGRASLQRTAHEFARLSRAAHRLVSVTAHELPVPPKGDKQHRAIANAAYAALRRGAVTKRQARLLGVLGQVLMHRHSVEVRAVRRYSAQERALASVSA
jgi:hypothetical protein